MHFAQVIFSDVGQLSHLRHMLPSSIGPGIISTAHLRGSQIFSCISDSLVPMLTSLITLKSNRWHPAHLTWQTIPYSSSDNVLVSGNFYFISDHLFFLVKCPFYPSQLVIISVTKMHIYLYMSPLLSESCTSLRNESVFSSFLYLQFYDSLQNLKCLLY